MPDWMRLSELFRYLRAFYPTWDDAFAEELRRQFDLDPAARIKTLSQGQRARVGLLVALAYRPELLVLDEPSTGLDPIVRREILAAIIRTIAEEGRTVLFSSHLLDEVERVSDHVALVDRGRIVVSESLESIKASHRRLTLRFDEPLASPPAFAGSARWEGDGREWSATCRGSLEDLKGEAAGIGARIIEVHTPSLDEIFVARVGSRSRAGRED
jgi:ABC-2 type transport system ATP-binding protein